MLFGIGFRSWTYKVKDGFKYLILKIGFSRDLSIKIPFVVKVIILKPTLLLFKSLDKNKLNQFVALLRSLKIPDSYKGKGLRYIEEKIVLKLGKT
jgi:large subunit ribosomal protein L6